MAAEQALLAWICYQAWTKHSAARSCSVAHLLADVCTYAILQCNFWGVSCVLQASDCM